MASRINLLFITCRDFNFPHAGYVDVKLMRVKHFIKVKVITYLPKKISTRTDYYISHTENFTWEAITNNGVREVYDELLMRLNYTDKFTSHYGYSDGDIAGAYEDGKFLDWFCDTLFSFNADKTTPKFTAVPMRDIIEGDSDEPISGAMRELGRAVGVDAMIMAGRSTGRYAHSFGIDSGSGVGKSVVTTVRGGVEASKELKVSPLAKGLVNVRGVYVEPDSPEAKKYFGR